MEPKNTDGWVTISVSMGQTRVGISWFEVSEEELERRAGQITIKEGYIKVIRGSVK